MRPRPKSSKAGEGKLKTTEQLQAEAMLRGMERPRGFMGSVVVRSFPSCFASLLIVIAVIIYLLITSIVV